MGLKQLLVLAAFIVIGNAVFVFAGGLRLLEHTSTAAPAAVTLPTNAVAAFQKTLEGTVIAAIGRPQSGFTPALFLKYFPGLAATDFAGVQSNLGHYEIINGQITQVPDTGHLEPATATGAITQQGIATLLANVSHRTGINLAATGTMTQIIHAVMTPLNTSGS